MHDNILHRVNHDLITQGLRTIGDFMSDASAQAADLGDHTNTLQSHFSAWQAAQCNPEAPAGLNIRQTLEFRRNTLAKRQFRCDGSVDDLRRIAEEISAGTVLKYYENVITASELVKWWTAYTTLYKKEDATSTTS